eukprot:1192038-Prorocentrum_minimum.AAC.2
MEECFIGRAHPSILLLGATWYDYSRSIASGAVHHQDDGDALGVRAQVRTTMAAVCTLLREEDDWPTARRLLGDPGLVKRLVHFDKDDVPEDVLRALKKIVEDPAYTAENVSVPSISRPPLLALEPPSPSLSPPRLALKAPLA